MKIKRWICVFVRIYLSISDGNSNLISIQFIKIANADLLIMYKAVEREMVCVCVKMLEREKEIRIELLGMILKILLSL